MSQARRVLIVGETWIMHTLHQKGVDSFTPTEYGEGIKWLKLVTSLLTKTTDCTLFAWTPVDYRFW